ncbi:hypothetical protein Zm00014a_010392 [Zea mays]|uniref:HNH domain-containing protein n=1 Tax=Zea mays TaxID=4577 RepID=A0A317YK24_MAIZE|nr:hypothetical protein Zm00014a_010392 [Zea mays]
MVGRKPMRRRRSDRQPPPQSFATTAVATDLDELLLTAPPPSASEPRSFSYAVKQQCWEKAERVPGRDPERWRRDALGNIVFRKLVGCPGCLCHDYDHIVPYSKGGKSTLENCQVLQRKIIKSTAKDGNKAWVLACPAQGRHPAAAAASVAMASRCVSADAMVLEHWEPMQEGLLVPVHPKGAHTSAVYRFMALARDLYLQATVNRSKGNKTEISKSELIQKSAYCRVSGRDLDLVELSAYGNVRRGPDSGGCKIQ